jgi:hypothetical protein
LYFVRFRVFASYIYYLSKERLSVSLCAFSIFANYLIATRRSTDIQGRNEWSSAGAKVAERQVTIQVSLVSFCQSAIAPPNRRLGSKVAAGDPTHDCKVMVGTSVSGRQLLQACANGPHSRGQQIFGTTNFTQARRHIDAMWSLGCANGVWQRNTRSNMIIHPKANG